MAARRAALLTDRTFLVKALNLLRGRARAGRTRGPARARVDDDVPGARRGARPRARADRPRPSVSVVAVELADGRGRRMGGAKHRMLVARVVGWSGQIREVEDTGEKPGPDFSHDLILCTERIRELLGYRDSDPGQAIQASVREFGGMDSQA